MPEARVGGVRCDRQNALGSALEREATGATGGPHRDPAGSNVLQTGHILGALKGTLTLYPRRATNMQLK
jgi:hypothetical protein